MKGYTFGADKPTIPNPKQDGTIVNSIYIDTHHLLSKLNSTSEHEEYLAGDRTDWAHYGAGSMDKLGELFAACVHYLMITDAGPVQQKVTFSTDGGSVEGGSSQYAYIGEKITLPSATRDGYTFNGWYTAAIGGELIGKAGDEYLVDGSVTMYAQWTEVPKVQYTITVTTNGATVSGVTNGQKFDAGSTVTIKVTYNYNNNQKTQVNGATVNLTNGSYTFVIEKDTTISASSDNGCFTPDTLITLADGTQKRVDELTFTDKILAWDFFTGTYVEKEISLLVNHGDALYRIANLRFSDGAMLRIIAEHGIFDYDLNKFVYITADNMNEYVGHRFVKYAADGSYDIVTLVKAYETEEYTSAWSVSSAITSNAFASGLLTVAPPEDFYNWIAMDGKLTYDVEQFQKDVETYGLYTYDDFKDYVTYEQFVAWNGAYLKVAVEKGYFTFDYILELIELYKGWMP